MLCVTLKFRIFSKIESKNFPFLRQSHSPRMPGLTHPQGNQGNVWKSFNFHFIDSNPKRLTRFLAAVALSPNICANLEHEMPRRAGRRITDLKVAKEEDHYWSCVTIKSCLWKNWHISICISMPDLKNISLSSQWSPIELFWTAKKGLP